MKTFERICASRTFKAIFKKYLFIIASWLWWVYVAACGLSPVIVNGGCPVVAVLRFLIAVASLVVEHRLQAQGLQSLQHVNSVVVACRLQSLCSVAVAHEISCSEECGILLDHDRTGVSYIASQNLNHWTTRESLKSLLDS